MITGLLQDWRKQKLHSWQALKVSCAQGPRGKKAVTPYETGPDLPASIGGSLAEARVAVAHCGDKDTGSSSSEKYSLA